MVEWNGIFRVFRFSGILGQPREVHPKFRNEIPENDCSIRSSTRNFRNFWSNGKRPITSSLKNETDFPVKTHITVRTMSNLLHPLCSDISESMFYFSSSQAFSCVGKTWSWGSKGPRGGGGDSHMKQTGMLVGNFKFNP